MRRRNETMRSLIQRQQHANSLSLGETKLDALQRHAFDYFLHETNPANGLVVLGALVSDFHRLPDSSDSPTLPTL